MRDRGERQHLNKCSYYVKAVCFLTVTVLFILTPPTASREQLRRRQGSAASGEEAGTQADREVLV